MLYNRLYLGLCYYVSTIFGGVLSMEILKMRNVLSRAKESSFSAITVIKCTILTTGRKGIVAKVLKPGLKEIYVQKQMNFFPKISELFKEFQSGTSNELALVEKNHSKSHLIPSCKVHGTTFRFVWTSLCLRKRCQVLQESTISKKLPFKYIDILWTQDCESEQPHWMFFEYTLFATSSYWAVHKRFRCPCSRQS